MAEKMLPYSGRRAPKTAQAIDNLTFGGGRSQGGRRSRRPANLNTTFGGSSTQYGAQESYEVKNVPGMGYVPSVKRQPTAGAAQLPKKPDQQTGEGGEKR